MRKYRVTEKHPVFKVNLIIIKSPDEEDEFNLLTDEGKPYIVWEFILQKDIDISLKNGWIEEIKEATYNTAWVEKMKLMDDILSKHHIEDLETLKKILEHEDKNKQENISHQTI